MAFDAVRSVSLIPVSTAIPQRRLVTITTDGEITLATAAGDAIGVTLEASAANSQVAIPVALLDGARIEIEANAAITAGSAVAVAGTSGDAGRVDDTAAAANTRWIGYAVTAASAAGEVVDVITSKVGFSQN